MTIRALVLAALFGVLATAASAAGLRLFEIPADDNGPAIQVAEWSPCAKPAEKVEIGPFTLPAVRDCPITGDRLPLIVLSHGFGGSFLGHHDTAETLAQAGFIVVALNHPDDTASNKQKERSLKALTSRPTDVRRVIDFMLGPSPDAARIDPRRIGFFGFSRGGYTGLVLAGGTPDFQQLRAHCPDPTGATCGFREGTMGLTEPLIRDPRIRAFVIADPLSSVFPTRESLMMITAPVQLWGSERGGDGVSPEELAAVARNLPVPPELHVVPGSGHFAFLTVCPAALVKALPELCTDAPGFDRGAFHEELNARALAFFRAQLPATTRP